MGPSRGEAFRSFQWMAFVRYCDRGRSRGPPTTCHVLYRKTRLVLKSYGWTGTVLGCADVTPNVILVDEVDNQFIAGAIFADVELNRLVDQLSLLLNLVVIHLQGHV